MTRFVLIHGYVEDPTIFDQLVPLLPPADVLRLDLQAEFTRWQPAGPVSARSLAQYLTDTYQLTATDVLIGHSMGGWIAINIKELTGATVIQLGSWTDQRKINFPVRRLSVLRFMVRTGLTQSRPLIWLFQKMYPFRESYDLHYRLVEGMGRQPRRYLRQQLETLFAPVPPLTVQPDLRVHARPDNIVFCPDEPYEAVPGDHFCLVYHAPVVAERISACLNRSARPAPAT